jgi:hypothetical protein
MRTSLSIIFLMLLFHFSNAQTISIADLEKSLNKDKEVFIKIIEAKGFKPGLQDLEKIANDLALTVSEMTGKKFIGKSFMHSSNYTATIIYDEKGIAHMVQFGTKRPKDDEVKKLSTELLNLDYIKTRDDESEDGRSNIRAYNKGDKVFSLAAYYNGGYTLTSYLKVLE